LDENFETFEFSKSFFLKFDYKDALTEVSDIDNSGESEVYVSN